jgi:integrase
MARKATGQVIERDGKRGRTYALRFRAYGQRQYVTLGTAEEGWNRAQAEERLRHTLADVERGIWKPPEPTVEEPRPEPTFHEFASEWLEARRHELGKRTVEDYTWALSVHLLPFFARYRVGAITIEDVDRYRTSKVREGRLGPHSINKTISYLSTILEVAVEYGYIDRNPARGRRRRLQADAPRRQFLEADQVRALLDAAGKHRTLLATAIMAGGLRVSEVAGLRWCDRDPLRGGRGEGQYLRHQGT